MRPFCISYYNHKAIDSNFLLNYFTIPNLSTIINLLIYSIVGEKSWYYNFYLFLQNLTLEY